MRPHDTVTPRGNLWVVALAASGLFAVLQGFWSDRIWPLTSDSAGYVGIAYRWLTEGRLVSPIAPLTQAVPDPATYWPPGYPLALAAVASLGVDPVSAGRWVSLLFGQALVLSMVLAIGSRWTGRARMLLAAWIVLLPAVTLGAQRVGSDMMFACIVFVTLWSLRAALHKPTVVRLVLVGFGVSLATSVRWVGGALGASVLAGLALQKGASLSTRVRHFLWILAGAAPVGVALLVWRGLSGSPARAPYEGPLLPVLEQAAKGIGDYILGGAATFGVVPLLLAQARSPEGSDLSTSSEARTDEVVHGSFVAVVLGVLVWFSLAYHFDGIDQRTSLAAIPSVVAWVTALVEGRSLGRWGKARPRCCPTWLGVPVLVVIHAGILAEVLSHQPYPPLARSEVAWVTEMLPRHSSMPLLTTNPMVAVERPDLAWQTPQAGPNARILPLSDVLAIRPDLRGSLVVFSRDLAESWAHEVRAVRCRLILCIGRLPD